MSTKRQAPVPLPEAIWPSRKTAAAARLFQPIVLGPLTLRTRTWVPAMVPWRATGGGEVTPQNLDWYGRFAQGRPGALVAEATGIRDIPSGPLLRIGHDRFVPGLQDLTQRVREQSHGQTKFFIQLIDFLSVRRRPTPEKYFARYLQVTARHRDALAERFPDADWQNASDEALRSHLASSDENTQREVLSAHEWQALQYGYRESVTDTHLPHVAELPKILPGLFADASARAREAGFDGVELHFAHAYTMASFLSRTNDRDDGYGGSIEGRARLALEVLAAVRERVGADYCIGARFLGDDVVEGGSRVEDAAAFGVAFANAGMDFLSVSKGGRFEDAKQPRVGHAVYPYTGPSGHECMPTVRIDERGPFGRNLPLAAHIRSAVRAAGHTTPVVAAGGFCTFEQMEQALQDEHADIIASARQSLADPDWFRKMELGHGEAIRRCVFTNYCEGLDQMHLEVTCKLWDKDFDKDDARIERSADGRRQLVPAPWKAPEQMLILCDEHGINTGYERRGTCHEGQGLRHRAIMVIPRDAQGRVGLQKRRHHLWDGYWDVGGATHPIHAHAIDETDAEAAARCLLTEWNVSAPVVPLFSFAYRAEDPTGGVEFEYCTVFEAQCLDTPTANPAIAYESKWTTLDECAQAMKREPESFTPWAREAVERLRES